MKSTFTLLCLFFTFIFSSFSQDQCAPVGWATQNGGTTGGGSAAAVTVTTLSDLTTLANSSGSRVIYVSGTVGNGVGTRVKVASNTTIIGLPGATLVGGFDIKDVSNVIIRNMIIQGPGAIDVNGVDCITIDGATNVWIDHCEIYDGQDGNLDIVNQANYISVTWTKFHYTSASTNHQFCNLVGNSDSKTTDRGHLKVTFMYNWWTTGCVERMPRVRFGQVHVVNNLFDSPQGKYCVRAGLEADILVEGNYFDGVNTPVDLYQNDFTAVTVQNNDFNNVTGNTAGSGTSFTPPYSLNMSAAAIVKSTVSNATCGAGATMPSPAQCACASVLSLNNSTTQKNSNPTNVDQEPVLIPNPSTGASTLRFAAAGTQKVWVSMYTADGRFVKTIANNTFTRGTHTLYIDYEGMQPGLYYILINYGDKKKVLQNVVIK